MSLAGFFRRTYRALLSGPQSKQHVFAQDLLDANETHIKPSLEPASCVQPVRSSAYKTPHAAKNFPSPSPDIALNDEQQHVVNLILAGRNVFYTGAAGTGKSAVLHAAAKTLRSIGKYVIVTAPTGKAAFNVNGMTTWAFAGWTPEAYSYPLQTLCKQAMSAKPKHRMDNVDVLIIDEVSMVENHHLARLSAVMAHHRAKKIKDILGKDSGESVAHKIRCMPFGGCQVIVVGDFFQLPPVLPFQNCIMCGERLKEISQNTGSGVSCPHNHGKWSSTQKWAFKSRAWKSSNFTNIELKTVFRQKEDTLFLSILNRFRLGTFTKADVDILVDPNRDANRPGALKQATRLFPTKAEVSYFNNLKLQELLKEMKPTIRSYSFDKFRCHFETYPHLKPLKKRLADGTLHALKDHRYEPNLHLTVGMPVILLANLDISSGLFNGAHGTIVDFCKPTEHQLSRHYSRSLEGNQVSEFIEEVDGENLMAPVVRFGSGEPQIILPDCLPVPLVHELEAKKYRIRNLRHPNKRSVRTMESKT
ncbi:ATP-dependent DNA helicase PIF1 [Ceratocystis fimbriata CBS 114723]|uniref:ATP-dependent DNA helicase n=1 Tax=Ceratocystis fimbriata CBS 114723 TaxID=1035309 RepID=A0A2C5XJB1_9PEZI|nr:ATP-dependent DNA helicase PIF1 [Ceratocystis fimbriata CBS 114723]